jgi:TP901 family phage tail tape measure protein
MSAESLQILIELTDKVTAPLRGIQDGIEGLSKVGNGFQSIGRSMMDVGRQMTVGVTAPIVGGLALATNAAIQYESALSQTNKALNAGPGTSAAAEIREEVSALAIELGAMPTAVAGMYTEAGKLGVLRDQMEEFVTLVNSSSVAWDMSGDAAAESVSKLTNVLGYQDAQGRVNIEGLNHLGDVINYLADSGATSEAAIANVLGRAGGTTRSFGLASESAAGLAAGFLNLGDAPEVVATALNGMLPMLQNSTRQTSKFQAGLEELGLSAEQMEGMIKEDAAGAFQELVKRLHETENASGVIADMFGSGSDSAMLAKAAQNYEAFAKTMNSANNVESGGMAASFENQMQTTEAQLGVLQAQMFLVGANIGSAILPALNEVIAAIQPVLSGFAKFAAANEGIVKVGVAIALVAAAVGPLLVIIGSVVTAIGTITGAIAAVQTAMVGVAAAGGIGAILGGIAFAPIIAGIAAVAAGAFLIYKNWSTIKEFFAGFADGFMSGIQPVVEQLMPLLQFAGEQIGITFGLIKDAISGILSPSQEAAAGARNIGEAFGLMAAAVLESVINLPMNLMQIFSSIGAIIMAPINAIRFAFINLGLSMQMALTTAAQGVQAAWQGLVAFFSGIWNSIRAAAQSGVSGVVNAVRSGGSQALEAIRSAGNGMVQAVSGIAGRMFSAGARIVQQLAAGIRSAIGAVTSAISSVTAAAGRFLPGSPVKEGALTVVNNGGAGFQIMEMLASGFSASPITSAMQSALSPMAGMLPTAGAGVANTGVGISPTVGTAAPSGGGSGISLTYAPQVTLGAGASQGDFAAMLRSHRDEIQRLLEEMDRDKSRASYGTA